jgi:type IV secretory pathway TraG/TraD family ATPase VirD4
MLICLGMLLWTSLVGIIVLVVIGMVGLRIHYSYYAKHRTEAAAQLLAQPDLVTLGTGRDGDPVVVNDAQLSAHGLLVGATGSGKTTSLLKILCQEIERGRPVIAIDLKGSSSFAGTIRAACLESGRPFLPWSFDGELSWNPLLYGDASELKDKLIAAERFTEPHYQRAAERYLQTAIQVLQEVRPDKPVTLAAVVALLDPTQLKTALAHAPRELVNRVGPYISQLNRDQRSAVDGIQSRLAILSESRIGGLLQPAEDPNREINLRRALCGGSEVVVFSLNSGRNPKLAAQIAAMVVQDLIAVAGYRLETPNMPLALVAIDEFSALDTDNLLGLLARARESGISVLLSTQELADLERLAKGFKDQVLGNTAITIAHRQNVPDSAELVARMIGTNKVWQRTHQTQRTLLDMARGRNATSLSGMGTIKQVDEFRIHPNVIKELPTGRAVLITKIPTASATLVQVAPWHPHTTADGT